MLPDTGNILKENFTFNSQTSKTYRIRDGRIRGMTEGLDAVKQAVYCILNTERFQHIIYSWNYGTEFNRMYGRSIGAVQSKIKKRIKEALTQDDRIKSVGAFSFEKERNRLMVRFTVTSVSGSFQAEKEVRANV